MDVHHIYSYNEGESDTPVAATFDEGFVPSEIPPHLATFTTALHIQASSIGRPVILLRLPARRLSTTHEAPATLQDRVDPLAGGAAADQRLFVE